jgi:hypothetical protein
MKTRYAWSALFAALAFSSPGYASIAARIPLSAPLAAPPAAPVALSGLAGPLPLPAVAAALVPLAAPASIKPRPAALAELRASADPAASVNSGARFDGGRAGPRNEAVFVVNDESVRIYGRAADYYAEVRRLVGLYQDKIDLSHSLHVMDDSYGDVVAKLSAIEAVAARRGVSQENTHLEKSLMFVDGVLRDGGKKVAVHTMRVYFHQAANAQSEVREGIRRLDAALEDVLENFQPGGRAERSLGPLDAVELVVDARGYPEIREAILKRASKIRRETHGRVRLRVLDDLVAMPRGIEATRERLNQLVARYAEAGVGNIIEGVIYSRYVGLLLELKTLEHYHRLGYAILQSGRELFDEKGMYVSELDAVVKSPAGKVVLVEAKSARIPLDFDVLLESKITYKLETYRRAKKMLDGMIGEPFDEVVFAMDFGMDEDAQPRLAPNGRPVPGDLVRLNAMARLKRLEPDLTNKCGFPVRFLFLRSEPGAE